MKGKISRKKLIIIAVIAVLLIIFCYWQNNMLTVTRYTYASPKVSADADGFTIVQISDLHNKSFGRDSRRLIDKIRELDPDIIVLTGDLVDGNHTNIPKAVTFAEGAAEIADTFFITGNHETWLSDGDFSELIEQLNGAGVNVIDDSMWLLGERMRLYGISDETLCTYPEPRLPEKDDTHLNILLAHEPQYIEEYAASGADLVLTGHAHGGQFRLPFIGGLIAPDQGFFPKYTEGVHERNDMTMVISRGLGNSVIPVRLFNFPEIVVVTLKCT